MALLQVISVALFLFSIGISATTCATKNCGVDYQVTSWPNYVVGSNRVFYYEVTTTSSSHGAEFTDVLLQMGLTCQTCTPVITCYGCESWDSWDIVTCPTHSWVSSNSVFSSKSSTTSGLQWTLPKSTLLRFSISFPSSSYSSSASGTMYVQGSSYTSCPVTVPVCRCSVTCPPCPQKCYRSTPSTSGTCPPCNNCTACVTGTYQTGACNASMNTQCANCTVCLAGRQYKTSTCNGTMNTQCANCTGCQAGKYQTAPCNSTTNTQCANCTTCQAGKYQTSACNATMNTQCANCTNCQPGYFQKAPCNATSPPVCQRCSNCSATQEVLSPCNATNDVVCVPCPVCANCTTIPNSHISATGTNCSCNDGYVALATSTGFTCVAKPCCADCQACAFNTSAQCFNHTPALCDYSCLRDKTCTNANYTISFGGVVYDQACCGSVNCTCFTYVLTSPPTETLNTFVLGVRCGEIGQCDAFTAPPCIDFVVQDNTTTINPFLGTTDLASGVTGFLVQGLGLTNGTTSLKFQFEGYFNVSSIPVVVGASGSSGEANACFDTSIAGPSCPELCTFNANTTI